MDYFNEIINFIEKSGLIGVLVGALLIVFESIIPILPLMIFITINFLAFGSFFGFLISWIFTIIGCAISYFIFKKGLGKKFEVFTENKEKINKYKKVFKNISLGNLTFLIALPFTPAFLVNIACGLVNMDFKKFFIATIIGKISLVYYCGFIGTSILESFSNPVILIKIVVLLLFTYILTKIVNKILKIK